MKVAVEVAAFGAGVSSIEGFTSGTNGIPPFDFADLNSPTKHFVGAWRGILFVLYKSDGSDLAGSYYLLEAQIMFPLLSGLKVVTVSIWVFANNIPRYFDFAS